MCTQMCMYVYNVKDPSVAEIAERSVASSLNLCTSYDLSLTERQRNLFYTLYGKFTYM